MQTQRESKIWATAIILNDNDFGSTFANLLRSVRNFIQDIDGVYELDDFKKAVEDAIFNGIPWHYETFQNHKRRMNNSKFILESYLTRDKIKVLFNEEAYFSWENEDHDSGACISMLYLV